MKMKAALYIRYGIVLLLHAPFIVSGQSHGSFPHNKSEDRNHIMSDAYWARWNDSLQQKIDKDIDRNRKSDAEITLTDAAPGSVIQVKQTSHSFVFGANIFNFNQLGKKEYNDKYKVLFGSLFNRATIPFYWKAFEPEPDKPRFKGAPQDSEVYWDTVSDPKLKPNWRRPATDPVVAFCESKHIMMHGHTLVWPNKRWQEPSWIIQQKMSPSERKELDYLVTTYSNDDNKLNNDIYTDEYKKMSVDELIAKFPEYAETLQKLSTKRIKEIANHYGDRIPSWDVVNESADDYEQGRMLPGKLLCKSRIGIMQGDYAYNGFLDARKYFPHNVKLNINDYNRNDAYPKEIKNLLSRGAEIDIAGVQLHIFNPHDILDIADGADLRTPQQMYEIFNRDAKAGLPIHLSEVTIPAPGADLKSEKMQAIVTRNLYRLWFSLQPLIGITWWNIVDNCGAPGEPATSGLFTREMKPKQAFYALNQLINREWTTNLTTTTDSRGKIKFRGFKGDYLITWKDSKGHTQSMHYTLK